MKQCNGISVSPLQFSFAQECVVIYRWSFKLVCFQLRDDILQKIITPRAIELMRVFALTKQGYIYVTCYYSPHFSITFLSQVRVIKVTGRPKQYISKVSKIIQLFFAPNEVLGQDLLSNSVDLKNINNSHDYGTCMLTCVHHHKDSCSISVPGIITSGLFYSASYCFYFP